VCSECSFGKLLSKCSNCSSTSDLSKEETQWGV
jgi:hypothetical protein